MHENHFGKVFSLKVSNDDAKSLKGGMCKNMKGNHFGKVVSLHVSNEDAKSLKWGLCKKHAGKPLWESGFPARFH